MSDITSQVKGNGKIVVGVFVLLFLIVIVKAFFALNNSFDLNNPQEDQYEVDTSFNTGINDVVSDEDYETDVDVGIDDDLLAAVIFLVIVGVFVLLIGR